MPRSQLTDAYVAAIHRLVETRKRLGVTQVELALRLGKTQQWVSAVEQSSRRIDIIEFCAIVRAVGADPAALFGEILKLLPERLEI